MDNILAKDVYLQSDGIKYGSINAVLLFYIENIMNTLRPVVQVILEYLTVLSTILLVIVVLYILYKSYFSPIVLIKEYTDVGFDHLPQGKDRGLHISRALNARKYSPKLPPPYPNGWFAIAESIELKVGGVLAVDALGQNFCVYRGEDGVARVVDAYCPHLGANMGVGGRVTGNCIECPFHRWTFAEDGSCVRVYGNETAPKGVSIKTWLCKEVEEAVWVWHDAEGREPLWDIDELPELKTWGYRARNECTVGAHIQEIPENGADYAHLNVVHAPAFFCGFDEKFPFLQNFVGHHNWSAEWSKGEELHTAIIKIFHEYKIMKMSIFNFTGHVVQMGPGHVRLKFDFPFGPMIVTQSVTPLGPLQQKVVHRIFTPAYNAPLAGLVLWGETLMFIRDIKIWNNKRFESSPAYTRLDKLIRSFRSWYSQFYSENSLSFRDAVQNPLDW